MTDVTLGQVAKFTSGGTPSRKRPEFYEGQIPWITGADIDATGRASARSFISRNAVAESAASVVPAGTVVLVTRTSVGKVGVVSEATSFSQDITAIHHDPAHVDRDFLVHYLRSQEEYFSRRARGATIKGVTRETVAGLPIPLPSLDEQRRIAAILARADALRTKRRQALAHLEDLTQSIFLEMFGDPRKNPMGWNASTVGEVCTRVTDGEHKTPRRSEAGVPLLSARSIRRGWIDFSATDFIDEDEYDVLRKRIEPQRDDVLISCSGTIGRVARVREVSKFAMVRSAALVRPGASVSAGFLEQLLTTASMNSLMNARANSSAQANLFQNQIKALPIVVPPLEEQVRFEFRLEQVRQRRDALVRGEAAAGELFDSLQSEAFAGRL